MTRCRRRSTLVAGATALVLALAGLSLLPADKVASGAPTGASPLVYVESSSGEGVGQVDAFRLTDVAGATISPVQADNVSSDGSANGLAITRDSSRAAVISNATAVDDLAVVDTSNGTAGSPLTVAAAGDGLLDAVATDPANSALVYALTRSGYLFEVNLDTDGVSEVTDVTTTVNSVPSAFSMFAATSLALAADGTTAYIGAAGFYGDDDGEAVLQVPLNTPNPPVSVWAQPAPAFAERIGVIGLALTPSGSEIFGCDRGEVFGLKLPISQAESPFDVVAMPGVQAVTVGPHGKNLYAGVVNANREAMLEGFAIADSTAVTSKSLQSASFPFANPNEPVRLAVTANGGSLVVTLTLESDADAPAPFMFYVSLGGDTGSGPLITPGPALPLPPDLSDPVAVAITPDQAPHASFSPSLGPAGSPSTFSAAASTVKYGSIVSYQWKFGDGSPLLTTSGDTATHVFASAGTYTVTLVERDAAGTSIPPAFPGTPWAANGPGQTPYRLSSILARTSQTVIINAHQVTKPTVPPKKPSKKPSLVLEPTVGPPGTVVSVVGKGFPNNAIVTIEWSTPNAASTMEKVKVHKGGFTVRLLILVPDLLGPRRAVAVSYPKANRPTFLVVADDEEPGGPNASPVFRSEGP